MTHMATISSKGQLVIPALLRRKYKLRTGSKITLVDQDGRISIMPDPAEGALGLKGILSRVDEDVEAWWMEEKRQERAHEAL